MKEVNEHRLDEIEEALLLHLTLTGGERYDSTGDEVKAMQKRLNELAENMRGRLVVGTGTLKGDR